MEEYNKVLKEIDELNVKYENEYLRYLLHIIKKTLIKIMK